MRNEHVRGHSERCGTALDRNAPPTKIRKVKDTFPSKKKSITKVIVSLRKYGFA